MTSKKLLVRIDFLMQHESYWSLDKGIINIDGHELKLHAKQSLNFCRRVYCETTTVIPANSQHDVIAQMPLTRVII